MPRGYASPGPLFLAKRTLRESRGGKCAQVNRRAPLPRATGGRVAGPFVFGKARSSRMSRGQMRPSQPPRALAACHGGTRRRVSGFGKARSSRMLPQGECVRAKRRAPLPRAAGGNAPPGPWFYPSALFAHVAGANAWATAARSCRVPRGNASPGPLFLATHYFCMIAGKPNRKLPRDAATGRGVANARERLERGVNAPAARTGRPAGTPARSAHRRRRRRPARRPRQGTSKRAGRRTGRSR